MSKNVCPPFICPKCGNEDVFVEIEMVSHACTYPGMEEPSNESFQDSEKTYMFECSECGHYQDAFSMDNLVEELDKTYKR